MKPENNIGKFFGKAAVDTNPQKDKKVLNKVLAAQTKTNIWRLIMRSPLIKYAVASCIVVSLIYFTFLPEQYAWAEVIKALNNTDNIHITGKRIRTAIGEVEEYQLWVKNSKLTRSEDGDSTHIVNGSRQLWLLHHEKTARFEESESEELFEWPLLQILRGEKTEYHTEIKSIGNDDGLIVYEVKENIPSEGLIEITNAWVDPRSNLPTRATGKLVNRETGETLITFEAACDYDPIPLEIFELVIPPDYTDITNLESARMSGWVIDENDRPVADAEIITPEDDLRGKTDQQGEFIIKLFAGRSLHGFPLIVRAMKNNDPNHVAWTLLRNPRHELRPLFIPDDGKSKLEEGGDVLIYLFDETTLRKFISENSGTFIFENDEDRNPSQVIDIELKMQPASVITGQITNQQGQPVQNAIVWLDNMEVSVGENEIEIHGIGQTDKEKEIASSLQPEDSDEVGSKSFTLTDEDGRYVLGNIPDIWYRARLEVKADGYVQVAKEIFQNEGNDFALLKADVTIRGTVIDDQGNPVIGREIDIDVDSDEIGDLNIEEIYTDSEGKFELPGIPEVEGLELEIRTDEKPYNWDENELTKDHEFVYYRMIEETIKFEPGKKEYTVNIVPHKPDIKIEIEVKDSNGKVFEGIPAGICTSGYSEHVWFTTKLCGVTDKNGLCIIEEVPKIDPLKIWICIPPRPDLWEDDDESEANQQVRNAVNELGVKYYHIEEKVDVQEGKKNYKVPVTLQGIE